jgi:hypothetical protein
MDDQEGIQNMYPPTRQAREVKIVGGYIFCIPSWSSIVI